MPQVLPLKKLAKAPAKGKGKGKKKAGELDPEPSYENSKQEDRGKII